MWTRPLSPVLSKDELPAEADIQQYFRVTPPTVHQMILRLAEKKLISRVPGQARTIQVLVPPEELPLFGMIAR